MEDYSTPFFPLGPHITPSNNLFQKQIVTHQVLLIFWILKNNTLSPHMCLIN